MNPEADTLDDEAIKVSRDMTWHLAMAAHSGGTAKMWIEIDPADGALYYGLIRCRGGEET